MLRPFRALKLCDNAWGSNTGKMPVLLPHVHPDGVRRNRMVI